MRIVKIWFEGDYLYGKDESGRVYRQSLLWYGELHNATAAERESYTISPVGIHWRSLDVDVSFESFEYVDAEPTRLQRFFLTHKEINVSELAKQMGLNATLLRNYINGFKRPSADREREIMRHVRRIGKEYIEMADTML